MVCSSVTGVQIETAWRSTQARHRQSQMRQPLFEMNLYSSWVKMLGSECGRPLNLKYLVQKQAVWWLLEWRPTTMAAHRARLLTWRRPVACGCMRLWRDVLDTHRTAQEWHAAQGALVSDETLVRPDRRHYSAVRFLCVWW